MLNSLGGTLGGTGAGGLLSGGLGELLDRFKQSGTATPPNLGSTMVLISKSHRRTLKRQSGPIC